MGASFKVIHGIPVLQVSGPHLDTYSVQVAGPGGVFIEENTRLFDHALALVEEYSKEYPRSVVVVTNVDRCDVDTNGLTEEEEEAVSEARVVVS